MAKKEYEKTVAEHAQIVREWTSEIVNNPGDYGGEPLDESEVYSDAADAYISSELGWDHRQTPPLLKALNLEHLLYRNR